MVLRSDGYIKVWPFNYNHKHSLRGSDCIIKIMFMRLCRNSFLNNPFQCQEAWFTHPKSRNGRSSSYDNLGDGTTFLFIVHGCLRQEFSICPSGDSALQACSPVVKRIPSTAPGLLLHEVIIRVYTLPTFTSISRGCLTAHICSQVYECHCIRENKPSGICKRKDAQNFYSKGEELTSYIL